VTWWNGDLWAAMSSSRSTTFGSQTAVVIFRRLCAAVYPDSSPSTRNAALITAGINTGVVSVTLDLLPERPADPDTADWDDVVEASIAHVDGGIALPYLRTEQWTYLPTDKPGPYRVRVYVRGRDIDRDGVASTAFEQYRLEVWPEDV
jgi:hypothetical protein